MKWLTLSVLWLFNNVSAHAGEVHVAVASNFLQPLNALSSAFEHEFGHEIIISSASSGKLYAQIQHGAPFDVFLSADSDKPARVAREIGGSSQPFAYAIGRLVLWCPSQCELPLTSLRTGNFTKLAIANPRLAPYGLAAKQTLRAEMPHKMKTQTTSDLMRDKWVMGENISQTYRFVETGNATLGFVARSQITGSLNTTQHWLVPSAWHQPIQQEGILLERGKSNPAAHDFVNFITSQAAQTLLQQYGYDMPHE
jgi:molybdate transport system substrate-binding protein